MDPPPPGPSFAPPRAPHSHLQQLYHPHQHQPLQNPAHHLPSFPMPPNSQRHRPPPPPPPVFPKETHHTTPTPIRSASAAASVFAVPAVPSLAPHDPNVPRRIPSARPATGAPHGREGRSTSDGAYEEARPDIFGSDGYTMGISQSFAPLPSPFAFATQDGGRRKEGPASAYAPMALPTLTQSRRPDEPEHEEGEESQAALPPRTRRDDMTYIPETVLGNAAYSTPIRPAPQPAGHVPSSQESHRVDTYRPEERYHPGSASRAPQQHARPTPASTQAPAHVAPPAPTPVSSSGRPQNKWVPQQHPPRPANAAARNPAEMFMASSQQQQAQGKAKTTSELVMERIDYSSVQHVDAMREVSHAQQQVRDQLHFLMLGQKTLATREEVTEEITAQLSPAMHEFFRSLSKHIDGGFASSKKEIVELVVDKVKGVMLELKLNEGSQRSQSDFASTPLAQLMSHLISKLDPVSAIATFLESCRDLPDALRDVAIYKQTVQMMGAVHRNGTARPPVSEGQATVRHVDSHGFDALTTSIDALAARVAESPEGDVERAEALNALIADARRKLGPSALPAPIVDSARAVQLEQKIDVLNAELASIKHLIVNQPPPPPPVIDTNALISQLRDSLFGVANTAPIQPQPQPPAAAQPYEWMHEQTTQTTHVEQGQYASAIIPPISDGQQSGVDAPFENPFTFFADYGQPTTSTSTGLGTYDQPDPRSAVGSSAGIVSALVSEQDAYAPDVDRSLQQAPLALTGVYRHTDPPPTATAPAPLADSNGTSAARAPAAPNPSMRYVNGRFVKAPPANSKTDVFGTVQGIAAGPVPHAPGPLPRSAPLHITYEEEEDLSDFDDIVAQFKSKSKAGKRAGEAMPGPGGRKKAKGRADSGAGGAKSAVPTPKSRARTKSASNPPATTSQGSSDLGPGVKRSDRIAKLSVDNPERAIYGTDASAGLGGRGGRGRSTSGSMGQSGSSASASAGGAPGLGAGGGAGKGKGQSRAVKEEMLQLAESSVPWQTQSQTQTQTQDQGAGAGADDESAYQYAQPRGSDLNRVLPAPGSARRPTTFSRRRGAVEVVDVSSGSG